MNTHKPTTVLIADDEPEIQNVLKRFLTRQGYEPMVASDGREAIGKAKIQNPNIVLLDVNMPKVNGFDVCQQLRDDPATKMTPILMLSGRAGTDDKVHGLQTGADDYLAKPFEMDELQARMETLLKRTRNMLSVNPLTRLPGSPTIQDEIESRIRSGEQFGVAYIDIDQFKAYNDIYGYHQGDQVILWTARMIQELIRQTDSCDDISPFVGHIGGDDFMLVAKASAVRVVSELIAREFDANRRMWYNLWHGLQNYVETTDRQGNACKFPLMALTVAVSTNEQREITHYGQVAQIVSELKKFAKNRSDKDVSRVFFDRRKF